MRFTYRQLAEFFADPLPLMSELAENLTLHAWEVEDVTPLNEGDWEFEVKILPDRAGDAKTPLGLAREINTLWPELKPKQPWPTVTLDNARQKIDFTAKQINDILGLELGETEITDLLARVGVVVIKDGTELTALIPSARLDLNIKEDLADEVMRLHGYDHLSSRSLQPLSEKVVENVETFTLANRIRAKFAQEGFLEVYGYTFTNQGELEIEKGVASDKTRLRTNLSDGLRRILEANLERALFDQTEVKLFEIGTVFVDGSEEVRVATAVGRRKPEEIELTEKKMTAWADAFLPEGNLDEFIAPQVSYCPVSSYPRIVRDLAVWVPLTVAADQVATLIRKQAGDLLVEGPVLFDEFTKDERKSLAFRLSFQALDRTLSDPEINEIMTKINQSLEVNSDWQVR